MTAAHNVQLNRLRGGNCGFIIKNNSFWCVLSLGHMCELYHGWCWYPGGSLCSTSLDHLERVVTFLLEGHPLLTLTSDFPHALWFFFLWKTWPVRLPGFCVGFWHRKIIPQVAIFRKKKLGISRSEKCSGKLLEAKIIYRSPYCGSRPPPPLQYISGVMSIESFIDFTSHNKQCAKCCCYMAQLSHINWWLLIRTNEHYRKPPINWFGCVYFARSFRRKTRQQGFCRFSPPFYLQRMK